MWLVLCAMGQLILTSQGVQSVNTVSGNQATFTPHYTTVLDLWSCAIDCGPSTSQYHSVRIHCLISKIHMEGGANFIKFGNTIPYCQSLIAFFIYPCSGKFEWIHCVCKTMKGILFIVVSHFGYQLQILISCVHSLNS